MRETRWILQSTPGIEDELRAVQRTIRRDRELDQVRYVYLSDGRIFSRGSTPVGVAYYRITYDRIDLVGASY